MVCENRVDLVARREWILCLLSCVVYLLVFSLSSPLSDSFVVFWNLGSL